MRAAASKVPSIGKFWLMSSLWSLGAGVLIYVGVTLLSPDTSVSKRILMAAVLPAVGISVATVLALLFSVAARRSAQRESHSDAP